MRANKEKARSVRETGTVSVESGMFSLESGAFELSGGSPFQDWDDSGIPKSESGDRRSLSDILDAIGEESDFGDGNAATVISQRTRRPHTEDLDALGDGIAAATPQGRYAERTKSTELHREQVVRVQVKRPRGDSDT